MRRTVWHRVLVLVLVLGALPAFACFDPKIPDEGLLCGSSGQCPAGQRCEAVVGVCVPEAAPSVARLRFAPGAGQLEARSNAVPVTVVLEDSEGRTVPVSGGEFALSVGDSGIGQVSLTHTPSAAASAGVIVFDDVEPDRPGKRVKLHVAGGSMFADSSALDVLPTRPILESILPVTTAEGCIDVTYSVHQEQGWPVDLEISLGSTASRASQAMSESSQGVLQAPPGLAHSFTWNSSRDYPDGDDVVTLTVTPSIDGRRGTSLESPAIHLQNGFRSEQGVTLLATDVRAAADVDGDGWTDLVSVEPARVVVDFAPGAPEHGSAVVPVPFPVGEIATGDFDADGIVDLALSTHGHGIWIAHGAADQIHGFYAATAVASPTDTRQMVSVAGELFAVDDDDGSVWQVGPTGKRELWPGSSETGRIAAGELGGGRGDDIAIGRTQAPVVLLVRGADGEYRPPSEAADVSGPEVALADLMHEGQDTLLALSSSRLTLARLVANPNGIGELATKVIPAISGSRLLTADLNHDGRIDLVTVNEHGVEAHIATTQAWDFGEARRVTGVIPAYVAVADYDGDARPDVLVGGANTTVFPNTTARRCGSGITLQQGYVGGATLLQVADVDADGKPDVIAQAPSGRVVVRHGLGDGQLAKGAGLFGVGYELFGDLGGDGWGDEIGLDPDGSALQLALRYTGGNSSTTVALAMVARAVALGDLDDDGVPDLLLLGPAGLQVMRGTAEVGDPLEDPSPVSADFDAAELTCSSAEDCHLTIDDLDGDGAPELVVHTPGHLRVFTRDMGGYALRARLDLPGLALLATGDVLGDRAPELLVESAPDLEARLDAYQLGGDHQMHSAWYARLPRSGNHAAVADLGADHARQIVLSITGDSTRFFSVADVASGENVPLYPAVPTNGSVAAADMDGNGRVDLVTCNAQACRVTLDAAIDAALAEHDALAPTGLPVASVAAADLDLDGLDDLVWLEGGEQPHVRIAQQSRSDHTFVAIGSPLPADRLFGVHDMDGDGRPDVLTGGEHAIYFNRVDHFEPGCTLVQARSLRAGELVAGERPARLVYWDDRSSWVVNDSLESCQQLTPVLSVAEGFGGHAPVQTALADMNRDGRTDVVTVGDRVWVSLQEPGPSLAFAPAISYPAPSEILDADVLDIDRDGWTDVVVMLGSGVWALRGGAGGLSVATPLRQLPYGGTMLAGDVDGDGWRDLLVSTPTRGTETWLASAADGLTWVPAPGDSGPMDGILNASTGQLVDLDRDGRMDLVYADGVRGVGVIRGR